VGTAVTLLVALPGGGLVRFNDQATHFTKFADDKGNDLLQEPDPRPAYPVRPFFGNVPKDGATANVSVYAPLLPAKDAREITLQGVLVFRSATRQTTAEQADVQLTDGNLITAGPYELGIGKVTAPDAPQANGHVTLMLQAHQDLSEIVSIKFFDAAGNEVPSSERGWGSSGAGSTLSTYQNYDLAQKPDAVTVKITYWTDLRDIEVPLDVKIGLGL
jgi:hypothetical protein